MRPPEFSIRDDLPTRGQIMRLSTHELLEPYTLPPSIDMRDITLALMEQAYDIGYRQAEADFRERLGL